MPLYSALLREKKKKEEWALTMKGKIRRNRALKAFDFRSKGCTAYRATAFLKSDEVLFPRELPDGTMGVKPRVVQAVDPFVQVSCGGPISTFMDHLKKMVFNHEIMYETCGVNLSFSIGSGKTADDLSEWFSFAFESLKDSRITKTYFCIFAGDDFYALGRNAKGELICLENDFSKYDRTQGVHALSAEYELLEFLGLPTKVVNVLRQTARVTPAYEDRRENTKTYMPAPVQRFTGGPDTTLGNSLNNMMCVVYDVFRNDDLLFTTSHELGFESKTQRLSLEDGPTFLKGWWIPTLGLSKYPFQWVPLPSQIIKLGKILNNPSTIYKQCTTDPMTAHKMAAKAMACSFSCVPSSYPLLGCYLNRLLSLTNETVDAIVDPFKPQVAGTACELDLCFCKEIFAKRYGFCFEDLRDLEKEIDETPFPGVMMDERWVHLARRDYG